MSIYYIEGDWLQERLFIVSLVYWRYWRFHSYIYLFYLYNLYKVCLHNQQIRDVASQLATIRGLVCLTTEKRTSEQSHWFSSVTRSHHVST